MRPAPRRPDAPSRLDPSVRLLPVLLLLVASACSAIDAPRQLRGNHVDADQLKELVPGTSTRADVTSLLGSPTTRATFDDNTWIYVSETTRTRVGRLPGVLAQDVAVLTFDQAGVLREVKHLNQDDSKDVSIVSRATPSPGSEASFMQQLLGNVGKFSTGGPASGSRSTPGGSGAATNTGL